MPANVPAVRESISCKPVAQATLAAVIAISTAKPRFPARTASEMPPNTVRDQASIWPRYSRPASQTLRREPAYVAQTERPVSVWYLTKVRPAAIAPRATATGDSTAPAVVRTDPRPPTAAAAIATFSAIAATVAIMGLLAAIQRVAPWIAPTSS